MRTTGGSDNKMDAQRFGSFLAQRRKEKGYTQKELASRLNVTDKAVSRWENGHGFPDISFLEPLSKELEVSLAELLRGETIREEAIALPAAEEMLAGSLELTLKNRRTERRRTALLFTVSILFILVISFLRSVPIMAVLAMGLALVYGVSGVTLIAGTVRRRPADIWDKGGAFYGLLLLLAALGMLFLLLGTSVNVVAP